LHVTDVHGAQGLLEYAVRQLAKAEKADLVIVSGDLELYSLEWLSETPVPVLATTGNMDDYHVAAALRVAGVILDGKCVEVQGVRFCGIGGLAVTRDAVSVLSASKGAMVDVLVSHYPPRGTAVDIAYTGAHIGKEVIKEVLSEVKPKLCLCGHVHESRGTDRVGETLVVNPGPLMWGYYAVIDLEEVKADLKQVTKV